MRKIQPIEQACYYHIYNRGINGENIFKESANYEYFLKLYEKHIHPVADTFAWCLMPNHFHILVRIKENSEIIAAINSVTIATNPERVSNPFGVGSNNNNNNNNNSINEEKVIKYVTQKFSNLFNSYAQAFNKRYKRHGSLFEKPFKRKLIDDENYFKTLVLYIHNNPVHHGFCTHPLEYSWSSYLSCITMKPTKLKRQQVIEWFDDLENFKHLHINTFETENIEQWLKI